MYLRHGAEGPGEPALPGAYTGMRAETQIARAKHGPFAPIPVALAEDAALRDAFAGALDLPLVRAWGRARWWLFVALLPLLMLVELDRELAASGVSGAHARLGGDLLMASVAVLDLARRVPRHPRTTALLLAGAAARFALYLARACGHGVHPAMFVAPLLALSGGLLVWRHAPRPAQIARAILARLSIAPADADAARAASAPTRAHLAVTLIAAVGMPLALAATRGLGVWGQAAVFAGYALIVPLLVSRAFEPTAPRLALPWRRVVPAGVVGFALTFGVTDAAHHVFDATAYTTRCVNEAAFDSAPRRALDAEGRDSEKNVRRARESLPFFLMTVFVVPLAEERIFRAMLQRTLTRKYGETRAIALSALLFGLAHLGVYRIAVYQTVLLGVGFGAAYAAGGYMAATIAHAIWNLHLVM